MSAVGIVAHGDVVAVTREKPTAVHVCAHIDRQANCESFVWRI